MEPLAIFVLILLWFVVVGIAVRVYRWTPTRKCPLCATQVELGKAYCQGCGYKFSAARFWT